MNRFELWDKVARNWQYRWQQPFRSVVALWFRWTLNMLLFVAAKLQHLVTTFFAVPDTDML